MIEEMPVITTSMLTTSNVGWTGEGITAERPGTVPGLTVSRTAPRGETEASGAAGVHGLPGPRGPRGDVGISLEEEKMEETRRLIQVVVIDPDERLDDGDSLLYLGEVKFTSASDQELYFELGIKEILEDHNSKRKILLDEETSAKAGREIYLKPIRIRDLRMQVIQFAAFHCK